MAVYDPPQHTPNGLLYDIASSPPETLTLSIICRAILPAWGAGPYLPALVLERPIFVREMNDGLYTALTYLTYKVGDLPCLKQSSGIILPYDPESLEAVVKWHILSPRACK